MNIRRIRSSDVPSFIAMWKRIFAEGQFLAKGPPPQDVVAKIVAKVVAETIPNFVAIENGNVIGAVEVFPGTMCGQNFQGADRIGVLGLQVDSLHRRRGIGTDLMHAAISDSVRYGYSSIELSVFESNTPAIRLYEGLGFVLTGHGESAGLSSREQYMRLNLIDNASLENDVTRGVS